VDKTERLKLELACDQADTWVKRYHRLQRDRAQVREAAGSALKTLKSEMVEVEIGGHTYLVLPLNDASLATLTALARYVQLAPISSEDQELLYQLDTEIPETIRDVQPLLNSRLVVKRDADSASDAANFLTEYVSWGIGEGIDAALERVEVPTAPVIADLSEILDPRNGLLGILENFGKPELFPAAEVRNSWATFTAAEQHPALARAVTAAHDFVVICSPPESSAKDLFENLKMASD
jgi:hypothetical protein